MSNTLHITGRLTSDPEIGRSEDSPLTLRIADNYRWKDGAGEWHEETAYHRVVTFQKGLARYLEEKAHKGDAVRVRGRLTYRTWRRDGEQHDRVEAQILIGPHDEIELL